MSTGPTKLKLPTPIKKPTVGSSAANRSAVVNRSTTAAVAHKLKRRSIDISNQPAAKKKMSVPSSGYGQSRQSGGATRPLTAINSTAPLGNSETFRRGVLPKTELRATGRPTTIAGNAMSGRPPPVVARKRSSVSSRQSDATWKEEMAARIEALEVEKREKGVLLQTTVSEKDHLIARLEADVHRLEAAKGRAEKESEALKDALCQANSSEIIMKSKVSALEAQLSNWQQRAKNLEDGNRLLVNEREELRQKCRQNEMLFRKLHNDIVDLKGNIRVMVRMRPLLESEPGCGQLPTHVQFLDDQKLAIQSGKSNVQHEFQRVFTPHDSQAAVFDELGELIQSALHGFNVTILAFGQTGSGKTFTMQGGNSEATMGVIPRAVRLIFSAKKELADLGWKYDLSVSFLEIYNEECRDLLVQGTDKMDIKVGSGQVKIPDLSEHPVFDANEVFRLLSLADAKRSVGATKCNSQSSRSHAIFKLRIAGSNDTTGETCSATLNLVDLAGSERLKESGAEGARLVETQHINTALSNLQNVIRAQWKKTGHVPYRNSKLTLVLQDALGAGSSKTLMVVNVSPLADSAEETRRSLEFAAQTSKTNIGAAKKV